MWLLFLGFLLVLSRNVLCTFQPSFTDSSTIGYSEASALSFPDGTGNCSYPFNFNGEMNFLSDDGSFLIGSADVLFMLNETTLSCVDSYLWETFSAFAAMCAPFTQETCHNYIRLYQKFPSESSRLLVCGTQSGISPQCRTLQFTDVGFNSPTDAVNASANLISNFPDLNQVGEFVETTTASMDPVYVSGAYFESIQRRGRFGTDFNITYHNVSYSDGQLTIAANLRLMKSTLWLAHPVSFIDVQQVDFVVNSVDVEYLFVFVREGSLDVNSEVVNSRVIRICRNDPGASGQFTTYIKSGIYCRNERPDLRSFAGDDDYRYTEMTSVVFNGDGSRYAENRGFLRMMYGAFSGPRLGPAGTAICVYKADYAVNRGVVGIFNDNLIRVNSDGSTNILQNMFLTCPAGGRDGDDAGYIRTNDDISQLDLPLMILDGVSVTQMVLDSVCVVRRTSNTTCRNQDVLFMGTDSGTVLKVAFATLASLDTEPVISEEISLGDSPGVDDMAIREPSGVKVLFVSTVAKVHRFPLERCSRHVGCLACIGARDPYCVWDNLSLLCVRNNISTTTPSGDGTVPQEIWQNIHTGSVDQCNAQPHCNVSAQAVGDQSIMCSAVCNGTDGVIISTSLPSSTSTSCRLNDTFSDIGDCKIFSSPEGLGLHSYNCSAESISSPSVSFVASVQTHPGPPTPFEDYPSCGQSSCTICVEVVEFTDLFSDYVFQVHYPSSESSFERTPLKRLSEDSGCVVIRPLQPGSTFNYIVEVQNSVSSLNSTLKSVGLLEGFSGPVEHLQVETQTNVSLSLLWSPPSQPYGVISGYSIYVNNNVELSCVQGFDGTAYSIDNLTPFTDYVMTVHACNGAGESNMSVEVANRTLCGIPSSVVNPSIIDITSDSMTFQWDSPVRYNGDIIDMEYQVTTVIYDVNGMVSNVSNVWGLQFYDLVDIKPETLCCADISAVTSCGILQYIGPPIRVCGQTLFAVPEPVSSLMVHMDTLGSGSFSLMWEPPQNLNTSPGVMYTVSITDQVPRTLTDTTFLYVSDLNPCTVYTVEVTAIYSGQSGPVSAILVTTMSLLPPPENVMFITNENGLLGVRWQRPSALDCGTVKYRLSLRCNHFPLEMEISRSSLSIFLNILEEDFGIGWCVSRMQSCDNARCGNFSNEATVPLYRSPPSQPRCFLQSQPTSTNVSISFAVSQPFIANSTRVEWNLTSMNSFENDMYPYIASSSNILDFIVSSNSDYIFNLRICDIYGCGSPCKITFGTSDIPEPPQNIVVSSITNTSAQITWRSTLGNNVSYTISYASSCPTGNDLISVAETNYILHNLCPHGNYTIAIRTTDLQVNESSRYSEIVEFSTRIGIPTNPRYVSSVFDEDRKEIRVTWIIPVNLNGIIDKYDVRWTLNTLECDKDNDRVVSGETDDSAFEYIISTNDVFINSYSVCVRAVTAETVGSWGIHRNLDAKTGGLFTPPEDCSTLTIVACIAALTVASSLFMSIVLAVSIIQKGWFCFKSEVHGKN